MNRKLILFLFISSLLIVWLDFVSNCFLVFNIFNETKLENKSCQTIVIKLNNETIKIYKDRCKILGIIDISNLRYHLIFYPFLILAFVLYPLIFYLKEYKLWLGIFLIVWTSNDLLWFLVLPNEWIEFWKFKGDTVYKFFLTNTYYLDIKDYLMVVSIVIRYVIGLYLLRGYIKDGNYFIKSQR